MSNVAYDLNKFAPKQEDKKEKRTDIKVTKRNDNPVIKPKHHLARAIINVVFAVAFVVLVCGVLYTQSTLAELQSDIKTQNSALKEEKSINASLTLNMGSKANLKDIEERAKEMGMIKPEQDDTIYIRPSDGERVIVKENSFKSFWSNMFDKVKGTTD